MSEQKKQKSFVDKAYDFLSSVTLSILVLIGLAITSIIGTVLQQNAEPSEYVASYGEKWAAIIQSLNLHDMYHAWWFQVLLALLLLNITFCSLKRLPHAIKLMKDRDPVFDGRPVAIHERRELRANAPVAGTAEKVSALLATKVGKVERAEKDGAIYLFSSRGAWSRMGVYVTHFSLFLFAVGALIGTQWGFKGAVNIVEGQTATEVYDRAQGKMVPIDFGVRCDKFTLEHYPDGRPKGYLSDLTVFENGREVVKKRIRVNDPLIHNGFYFYQSSYQKIGVKSVKATVAGPDRQIIATAALLEEGTNGIKLPDGTELALLEMWKDKRDPNGPTGIILATHQGGRILQRGVAFPPMQEQSWWPVGAYQVRLDEVNELYYTGLQVAKDPGVPVVWAGCILITFGLLISFFLSHRRVWAKISTKGSATEVLLAGNASRNRIAFEHWFETLAQEARETFEK